MPTHPIIARDAEVARIHAFLGRITTNGAAAVVIAGDAGVGKSSIWRVGVEEAAEAGHLVLSARPPEDDLARPDSGIAELLGRRAALPPDDDPRIRARALLEILGDLAAIRPVVIAIDDVQWLDPASARVLRFALRRLENERVGLLASLRDGDGIDLLDARTAFVPDRYDELRPGPLGTDAIVAIVRAGVRGLSTPQLRRIADAAAGNPLHALELARVRAGDGDPTTPTLAGALTARLETAPPDVTALLRLLAASGPARVAELERAHGAPIGVALERGIDEELLTVDDALEVRFVHPLIHSTVRDRTPDGERRRLHRRLAEVAADDDDYARHLARAHDGPDEGIAAIVEEAAVRVGAHGAFDLAADLARHARRLTDPADAPAVARRGSVEFTNIAAAGDIAGARQLIDELITLIPAGPERANLFLDRVFAEDEDIVGNDRRLRQALDDARDDLLLRAAVLDVLAWRQATFAGDVVAGLATARAGLAIAERLPDRQQLLYCISDLAQIETMAGQPDRPRIARALALARDLERPPLWAGPFAMYGRYLLWSGDLRRAHHVFERELARTAGNDFRRAYLHHELATIRHAGGDLAGAVCHVEASRRAAEESADGFARRLAAVVAVDVACLRGDGGAGREAATEALDWAERAKRPLVARLLHALAMLAYGEGDLDEAARHLTQACARLQAMGIAHAGVVPAVPLAIEVLAAAGDRAAGGLLRRRLEDERTRAGSRYVDALTLVADGALALADDDAAAPAILAGAVDALDGLGYAPDAARARLLHGEALRRASDRIAAATAYTDAHSRFVAIGAVTFARRAADALELVAPGRTARPLTPAEERVLRLVIAGYRTREMARTLHMSVSSVEAHLTRIYRKHGVRSRAELIRATSARRP